MNRIEKLIKEKCPDGVRRVRLGEVITHLRTGLNPRVHFKLNTDDAKGYYITVRELMGKSIVPDEKTDRINESACMRINERSKLQINDILFSGTGTIGRTAIVTTTPTNWNIKEGVYALTPNPDVILHLYLLYILHSENVIEQIGNKAGGSTVKSIPMAEMRNLQIPLPPLSIQQEIVEILDSFTALQQNLEDELKLRQKQYEHYREKLLTFEDGECEWKKLGDIASFKYGFTDKAKDNGDTRYVRITDITNDGHLCTDDAKYVELTEESKPYLLKKDDLVMARTGATFGKTLLYQEDYQSIYASFLIKIVFETNVVVPKYYWIFTKSSRYWLQANKLVGGGAQPQFNANALAEIFVPVPPIETQLQITQTLDRFESLISNLKTEIELRKKQYEYYREKLLTF